MKLFNRKDPVASVITKNADEEPEKPKQAKPWQEERKSRIETTNHDKSAHRRAHDVRENLDLSQAVYAPYLGIHDLRKIRWKNSEKRSATMVRTENVVKAEYHVSRGIITDKDGNSRESATAVITLTDVDGNRTTLWLAAPDDFRVRSITDY